MADPFARTYDKGSLTLGEEIAEEMKGVNQRIRYPGQGNQRRELVQNNTPRSRSEKDTSMPIEFHLSWIILSTTENIDHVVAKLYKDKIEFFGVHGDYIVGMNIHTNKSIKVLSTMF